MPDHPSEISGRKDFVEPLHESIVVFGLRILLVQFVVGAAGIILNMTLVCDRLCDANS